MIILPTKTKSGKDFFILIDDNGEPVKPVHEYLKHLCIRGSSKNTIRKKAYDLMIFWRYLKDNNFDYIEFAGEKSTTNKGAYENLTDYQLFLTCPDIKEKTVPIRGNPARKVSTVNQMMSSVLCFYKFLSDAKIVGELPMIQKMQSLQHAHGMLGQMFMKKKAKVKNLFYSKEPEREEVRYVSEEEFHICWNACTIRRNRVIIGLMFYGGLRVSEVIGLNLDDLRDINKNIIYVKYREDDENPDAAVKNHAYHPREEKVIVDDILRDEIISYINHDLEGIDTNYLIVNFRPPNLGGPMKSDTIRDMVERLGKKVNMNLHPHMFRHGCAMRMLNAGMDMKSISDKLRHKGINVTAETYARYDLKAKIKAQEKLAENLKEEFEPLDIDFDKAIEMTREVDEDE